VLEQQARTAITSVADKVEEAVEATRLAQVELEQLEAFREAELAVEQEVRLQAEQALLAGAAK